MVRNKVLPVGIATSIALPLTILSYPQQAHASAPIANDTSVTIGAGDSAIIELSDFITDADDNVRLSLIDLNPSTPDDDEDDLETTDGDWSVGSTGRLRFNPVEGFGGVSTISYTVTDRDGNVSNVASVSVTVVNPAPVAIDASVAAAAGDSAVIELSEFVTDPDDNIRFTTTDFDPSTADIDDDLVTDDGEWSVGSSGRVRFNPVDGFSGVASVAYTVSDDEGNVSNVANISVSVINPVPFASDALATVAVGESAVIELSEYVTDPDDNIRFSTTDFDPSTPDIDNSLQTADGEWNVGSSGRVRFDPADGFGGVATVPYAVGDDEGNISNVASISVSITNAAPVVTDASAVIAADEIAVIELSELVTDADDNIRLADTDLDPSTSDIDSDLVTVDGEWTVNSIGRVRFRPADGFSGIASIDYTVGDDEGNVSNIASLTVTVPESQSTAESGEAETEFTDSEGADSEPEAGAVEPESEAEPEQTVEDTEEQPVDAEDTTQETPSENSVVEDLDSDADGLPDSLEGNEDTDGDGISDYLDVDSDNDGISDAVEGADDSDADGIANFRDLDVDNDGIFDIVEARIGLVEVNRLDSDLNGIIDQAFATGSNGMADEVETTPESSIENYALSDIDADGIADFRDQDSDNDGLLDTLESDHVDRDLDGTIDSAEATAAISVLRVIASVGTNGLLPGAGGAPRNTDGDSLADFRDGDSDNDGVTDVAESFGISLDVNGDGRLDDFVDIDGNGVDDAAEAAPTLPIDTNGNGAFDAVEVDSDADGISDLLEAGGLDANGDGLVDDFVDTNADGIDDGINALPLALIDTDNDSIPDFQDFDSDNDGLSDLAEVGSTDNDGDGAADDLVNVLPDANEDGIPDHLQNGDNAVIAPARATILTGLSGGAGCSIGASGSTDPMLPGVLLLSFLWLARRIRQRG